MSTTVVGAGSVRAGEDLHPRLDARITAAEHSSKDVCRRDVRLWT
jgi:hypothetical protein